MARKANRFLRSETGSVSAEAVIMLPIVLWAVMATFVFFDAFRVKTFSQKAAYIVADALSREMNPVTVNYVLGMNGLHDFLARTQNATMMRVSSIGRESENGDFVVVWSVPAAGAAALTTAHVNEVLGDTLPDFPFGETIIYVETQINYEPVFTIGLPNMNFRQAIVTRPRFAPQIPFDDGTMIIAQQFGPPTCDDGMELCD